METNKTRTRIDFFNQLFIVNESIIIQGLFSTTAVMFAYLYISHEIVEIATLFGKLLRKLLLQCDSIQTKSKVLLLLFLLYEITSYFIVIYSCNTIGSQIVIIKDNNIESIEKLIENEDAIKPMFFSEDFSANQLNRMNMKYAIKSDLNRLTKPKFGHLESFLNRSTAMIGSSSFLRSLAKLRLCSKLNRGEKIHISREHFKTTQYGIGYSKCVLREVREIVDRFILNLFECKIRSKLTEKHFSMIFKGGKKCFFTIKSRPGR